MATESPKRRLLTEEFSARGLRLTSQRRALLEVMQSANEHLDAATLQRLACERNARVNLATVYRTLDLLKKLGLIDELDLMRYGARREPGRIHFTCFHCRRIEEFVSHLMQQFTEEISRKYGLEISVIRMEAGGRCGNCLQHAK